MCQIIALKTTNKKFKKLADDSIFANTIQNLLEEKGGDYYSATIKTEKGVKNFSNLLGIKRPLKQIKKWLKDKKIKGSISVLLFSRQQPEMEISNVQEQPYHTKDDLIFAVHGTVHNDKELSRKYNVDIKADTEIFQHLPEEDWNKAEGTYCIIGLSPYSEMIVVVEHGLKVWSNRIVIDGKHYADIISTTDLSVFNPYILETPQKQKDSTLFVAFSGGMDIALSTYKMLATGNYNKLVLNYFAWGSIAEAEEINQLQSFKEFYSKQFDIDVEVEIWDAKGYFDEYFKLNEAPYPKISIHNTSSSGEETETESPLAYVPYRNTQFALLMASKAEAKNLKNVDFLFGLNLSEGMVYMDNSEGWLDLINGVVKYGGKDYSLSGTYNIVAPYFPRTKTNMLKEFKNTFGLDTIQQLLDLSRSCYYPNPDGSPCGKCGSCLLREKALEKIKDI